MIIAFILVAVTYRNVSQQWNVWESVFFLQYLTLYVYFVCPCIAVLLKQLG